MSDTLLLLVQDVLQTADPLVDVLRDLEALEARKREGLVTNHPDWLPELTLAEEALVGRLGSLESVHHRARLQLGGALGLTGHDPRDLVRALRGVDLDDEANAVEGACAACSATASRVLALGQINAVLLRQAISYVGFMLRTMRGIFEVPGYGPNGQRWSEGRRLLDQRG